MCINLVNPHNNTKRYYYHPHFILEENEAQRALITCPNGMAPEPIPLPTVLYCLSKKWTALCGTECPMTGSMQCRLKFSILGIL